MKLLSLSLVLLGTLITSCTNDKPAAPQTLTAQIIAPAVVPTPTPVPPAYTLITPDATTMLNDFRAKVANLAFPKIGGTHKFVFKKSSSSVNVNTSTCLSIFTCSTSNVTNTVTVVRNIEMANLVPTYKQGNPATDAELVTLLNTILDANQVTGFSKITLPDAFRGMVEQGSNYLKSVGEAYQVQHKSGNVYIVSTDIPLQANPVSIIIPTNGSANEIFFDPTSF